MLKFLGNQSPVDSLIEYERRKSINMPLETLMETALEQWERDNRQERLISPHGH